MTTRYSAKALVFKKTDINESDRVFSAFTEEFGRLDINAKAIRKIASKLKGGIDIFSLSEIEFIQGKNRKTLTDTVVAERFSEVKQNIEKLQTANNIAGLLDDFIKGEEKDINIFDLIKDVFYKLNDEKLNSKKSFLVYYYFLWNLLSVLGYHPEVSKCNECSQKLNQENIYFSNKIGGAICAECASLTSDAKKINSDIVKILRLFLQKNWQIISRLRIDLTSQKIFQEVSDKYYSYVLSGTKTL